MDSSYDRIHSALDDFNKRWQKHVEEEHSDGLLQLARRIFKPNLDYELSRSLIDNTKQLDMDWMFLRMCLESIDKRSDAYEVVKNPGGQSVVRKIEAVADEIAAEINYCAYGKKNYARRPSKLLNLLGDCQRKTEDLKAEVREALDHLSGCSFQVHSPDYTFWKKFGNTVSQNLLYIRDTIINFSDDDDDHSREKQFDALYYELNLIQKYLDRIQAKFGSDFRSDHVVDAFLNHVASVVVRTANQSCNYWFYKKTDTILADSKLIGLLNLQNEIDPTNPEFLEFNLKFQKALKRTGSSSIPDFIDYFYKYLLFWRSKEDLAKDLEYLVIFYITNYLEDSNEAVQSFFAEIKAAFIEAAYLFEAERRKTKDFVYPQRSYDLLTRICLLKVEIFIEKQINGIPLSLPFGDCDLRERNGFLGYKGMFRHYQYQIGKSEYGRQSLELIEEVAEEFASLRQSLNTEKITEFMVKNSLREVLFKVVMFKAESFLTELLKNDQTVMSNGKDLAITLLEELNFFKRIVRTQLVKTTEDVDLIFIQTEAVARRITFFSYSFLARKMTEEMSKKLLLSFSELSEKVKHIKAKLKAGSPQFPNSNFPKTYALGFIDSLLRSIEELLKYDPQSIVAVKHHIKETQRHLKSLKSFLIKLLESDIEHVALNELGNHTMDVAYKVEYVIDSIEVDAHWQHFLWFYDLIEEIRLLDEQASRIHETIIDAKVQNVAQVSCNMTSRDSLSPAINEMVVDLCDEEEIIIDRLTRGSSQRDIVSIIGMAGLGKTTLARKVYNNQKVVYHFHRRAWCTVSQVYERRKVLLEILSDIHGLNDEIQQMNNEDLESKLRQCLLRNKYLIVMDDMWDVGAWNDLKNSFPDDNVGSRILLTSRLRGVPLEMKPDCDPHSLRKFSDEESWKLLEKKVFKNYGCPLDFLVVGKEIAQHCQGLPLAVVAIAGLLERTEKSQNCWRRIAESLSLRLINDPESRCMEILDLSYKHLPEHLKACFLYSGALLEDKDIPVSKLMLLWAAEGFIQTTGTKSVEDVAEDFLMDLIDRNLVMISRRRSNGKVKACRLHDLLRDLCRSKAKEENFFQLVSRYDEPYASFPGSDYGIEFDYDHHLDPVIFESYRLSISLKRKHFLNSRPSGLGTRSLIFFALTDSDPRCPYDISFISQHFKILRVLDLECINIGTSLPTEILLLVQLRYLALSGYVQSIPHSIANLWKLETFVLRGLRGKVILPETIWHMTRLRHLHVNDHVAFNLNDEELGSCFQLENLLSFSFPAFSCEEDTEKILKRLPNICKLKCIFLDSWDHSRNSNQFPALNFLSHLESLKIVYYGRALNPSEFILPFNLKRLTLSHFRLPWNHISSIGRLPNLEVLKLLSGAFEGRTWNMGENEFQELKFLKLDNLNIAQWNAASDHLPKLERLVLQNCKDLNKVPYDFADITTLEMIEVLWCGESAEESAKEIGDATGEVKVIVSRL